VLVNKRDDVTRAQAVAGGYYLNGILLKGTPPLIDLDDVCAVLTKIVEGITPPAPRPKGKPRGIKKYPKLDLLAYDLCRWVETYFTMSLTAYVKVRGQRVAAGSLIDALDALRKYLAAADQYMWLAAYIPAMSEQPQCVATYNRIIAEARDAVWSEREGTTDSSRQ
jgi:hypothetical protein